MLDPLYLQQGEHSCKILYICNKGSVHVRSSISATRGALCYELVSSKRYKLAYTPIEDSDQHVHLHSLMSVLGLLWVAKCPTFLMGESFRIDPEFSNLRLTFHRN